MRLAITVALAAFIALGVATLAAPALAGQAQPIKPKPAPALAPSGVPVDLKVTQSSGRIRARSLAGRWKWADLDEALRTKRNIGAATIRVVRGRVVVKLPGSRAVRARWQLRRQRLLFTARRAVRGSRKQLPVRYVATLKRPAGTWLLEGRLAIAGKRYPGRSAFRATKVRG